ncbi:SH3 domain-containing protein [Mycena chlorophos]|uniref:SH3 domain-containing protein n=1 Tax=Mycena chlorophos TaxID=658473 RepID=A0A8H6SIR1_MYCCL|nr:SH3 domain-containing protein [Mycena chlorophos]
MHIGDLQARARLDAGRSLQEQAKRLSNSGWANVPAYANDDDDANVRRQNTPVTFTGDGFTFTLDGAATLTETKAAGTTPPTLQSTASTPPAVNTNTVNTNTGAAVSPVSGFTTIQAPTPVASIINPTFSSLSSSESQSNSKGGTSANDGAQPIGGASTSTSKSGLSTGAIVGITIALVVLIFGALAVLFIRQRAIRQRKTRRATAGWAAAAGFAQPAPVPAGSFANGATMGDVERAGAMSQQSAGVSFARAQAAAIASAPIPPPPNAYGGAPVPAAIPTAMVMPAGATTALVRYEFIPSLPDELSIVTGETVRIVAEYDDGWALCANAKNDQGMVPLECLDRSGSGGVPRNSRRGSSLGARY